MHRDSPTEAEARHQEFLRSAISHRTVWSLQNEIGWAQWGDEDADEPIVPLWSEREAAAKCAAECFPEYRPTPIGLEILLTEWLPDLQKRGVWVGTNLTPEMTGIDMPAAELRERLEQIIAEPGAAPNGGHATQPGSSGTTEGPPSVS
jgi:hypothetical protein